MRAGMVRRAYLNDQAVRTGTLMVCAGGPDGLALGLIDHQIAVALHAEQEGALARFFAVVRCPQRLRHQRRCIQNQVTVYDRQSLVGTGVQLTQMGGIIRTSLHVQSNPFVGTNQRLTSR